MKSNLCLMLILIGVSVAGCASPDVCRGWRSFHPQTPAKALANADKRWIVEHNEHGEQQGCW